MKQWEYTSESEVSIAIIITMVNLVKTSKKKKYWTPTIYIALIQILWHIQEVEDIVSVFYEFIVHLQKEINIWKGK